MYAPTGKRVTVKTPDEFVVSERTVATLHFGTRHYSTRRILYAASQRTSRTEKQTQHQPPSRPAERTFTMGLPSHRDLATSLRAVRHRKTNTKVQ